MEALGRWKNPSHDRQLDLSFLCLLLHVTVPEKSGGRKKESEREIKKKKRKKEKDERRD